MRIMWLGHSYGWPYSPPLNDTYSSFNFSSLNIIYKYSKNPLEEFGICDPFNIVIFRGQGAHTLHIQTNEGGRGKI